jgi:hypothetical protein
MTVSAEYAAVAPRPQSAAPTATATVTLRQRCSPTTSTAATTSAPMSTTHRKAGSHSGVRCNSTNAHTPVTASMTANVARAARADLRRHSSATEMPTSAAIAGASARV